MEETTTKSRGLQIYDDFYMKIKPNDIRIATPSTFTLTLFEKLEEKGESELLLVELLKELLGNFDETKLLIVDGKVCLEKIVVKEI